MADEVVGIELRAIDEASGTIRRVGGALGALGAMGRGTGALGQLGGILNRGLSNATANLERYTVRLALLAGGAGLAAVHWSVDFAKNMALIETQAGASHDEVVNMTAGVKALVAQTGTGPIELAQMLYHIESAGIRGSDALGILKVVALGARIGIVDDAQAVTNAMIAIKKSGIEGVSSFAQSMSTLDAIIGSGNMRMEDLAHAMSTGVLGTSRAFGLSIQGLGAAIATLTNAGVPAQNASARLSYSLVLMGAPTANAKKAFKALGMGALELAGDLRKPDGIFAALSDLRAHLDKAGMIDTKGKISEKGTALVARAFGGGRFSATILQLLQSLPEVEKNYNKIMGLTDKFDQRVKATQMTAAYQFGQLWANIQNIGVKAGDALTPGLLKINTALNGFISGNQPAIDSMLSGLSSGFSSFVDKLMAVDWGSIARGIQGAAGMVGAFIDAFMAMPDWVKSMLLGGFALNKLTGGMVTDLAGFGIKQGLRGIGAVMSGLPGVAGLLGRGISATTATPVFVVNWPPGMGMGGGIGAGADLLTGATGLTLGTLAALAVTAVAEVGVAELLRRVLHPTTSGDPYQANNFTPDEHANYHRGMSVEDINAARDTRVSALEDADHAIAIAFGEGLAGAIDKADQRIHTRPAKVQPYYVTQPGPHPSGRALFGDDWQKHVPPDPRPNLQGIQDAQSRNIDATSRVRDAVDGVRSSTVAGFGNTVGVLYDLLGVLEAILAKPTTVVVAPSAQQNATAGAQQASYGPTRSRNISSYGGAAHPGGVPS